MVNLGSALRALYPTANPMVDYSIACINGEFIYEWWDEVKLGPKPSVEQVEQAFAQYQAKSLEKTFMDAVQKFMDKKAVEYGYDNIFTAVSYYNDPDPSFGAEGRSFLAWRSAVWRYCADYLQEVFRGERAVPELTPFLESLPVFVLGE